MTEIWSKEVASFDGEFARLSPSQAWPKPIKQPRPPVLLGGPPSARNFERVATWCNGWVTMGQSVLDETFAANLELLERAWAEAGRDPHALRLDLVYNPRPNSPPADASLDRCHQLGAERFMYHVFDGDRDTMLRRLDRAAALLD